MTTESEENYSITNSQEDLKKIYWDGSFNHACRYWYYLNKGIDIFNQFRYLFMLFFGLYFTMKLHNPFWILAMVLISLPILLGIGWLAVHRLGKIFDYLNIKFSTHYSLASFKLQQEIRDAVRKMADIKEGNYPLTTRKEEI